MAFSPVGDATGALGLYAVFAEIASGGMATVHLARLTTPQGRTRVVVVKRMHPQLAREPEFVAMFHDEARLAALVQHPNVVALLDAFHADREYLLVMEYVHGDSLSALLRGAQRQQTPLPTAVSARVLHDALRGLHAAHEARGVDGKPMQIVHRDVSPQNILVGLDGAARVLDFGVAKAADRLQTTREGQLKGKLPYMAPEQLQGQEVTRQTDVYAAGAVLWEALAGQRLIDGPNEAVMLRKALQGATEPPSRHNPQVSPALDRVVLRALARSAAQRYRTAAEFADALAQAAPLAGGRQVGEEVWRFASSSLAQRQSLVDQIERGAGDPPSFQFTSTGLTVTTLRDTNPEALFQDASTVSLLRDASTGPLFQDAGTESPTRLLDRPALPRRPLLWLAAPLAVAAGFALLMLRPGREAPAAPSPALTASGSATTSATGAPATSAAPPESASAAASSSAPAGPAPAAPTAASGGNGAAKVVVRGPKVDCNSPFYVDAKGIQRVKRECLR